MKFLLAQEFKVFVDVPKTSLPSALSNIVNILLFAAGALSVIFILVGAFQYIISGGNSENTRKAKDTILYALIGLVVSISAFALVNFVIQRTS